MVLVVNVSGWHSPPRLSMLLLSYMGYTVVGHKAGNGPRVSNKEQLRFA